LGWVGLQRVDKKKKEIKLKNTEKNNSQNVGKGGKKRNEV